MNLRFNDLKIPVFLIIVVIFIAIVIKEEGQDAVFTFAGWSVIILLFAIGGYALRRTDKNLLYWKQGYEKRFKAHREESYDCIRCALGWDDAAKIHGGDSIIDDDGLRLCKKIIASDLVKAESRLRFFILIRTASFLSTQYQFNKAGNRLAQALEIDPESQVVRVLLAEACEYAGDKEKALEMYQSLLQLSNDHSPERKYLELQIERIEKHGTKKPMQLGLKYMSY